MARTSVICETPELLRQVVDRLRTHPDVRRVGRVKNSFGETAVGKGGYRDIKVNLEPLVVAHFVEVQVGVVGEMCVPYGELWSKGCSIIWNL